MTRSWHRLRLPIALIFGQIIALGLGIGACSGSDPFTNVDDSDGGDGTVDGSIAHDAGKHDAGKDSGHNEASVGEGGVGEAGMADSPVVVDPGFDASLYCAQNVCTAQFCCASGLADGGVPANYDCQNVGTACAGLHEYCDDMADCHGKMCCATLSAGHVTAIGCATSCGAGLRICDPGIPTDCSSTGGGTCTEMPQLPGSNQFYCL